MAKRNSDELTDVNLSNAVNVTIADNRAIGTIIHDDAMPSLSINDISMAEGHSGTTQLTFTIMLSKPGGQIVTVNYATADGSAKAGSDYAATNDAVAFLPGMTALLINVTINGDTILEGNETLYLLLSGATNAAIGRGRAIGTITDDDSSG